MSMPLPAGTWRLVAVTSDPSSSFTVEGMITKPSGGSGPIHETNEKLRPPSEVRTTKGRPSRPFDLAAVMNASASCLPVTR